MTHTHTLRAAERGDAAEIAALAEEAELFPADMLEPMMAPYFSGSADDRWCVAVDSFGAVVGFGFCELERLTEGTWNLLAIGVRGSQRGTGVGRQLMEYVEQDLRAVGGRLLIVETLGTAAFAGTRRFYVQVGYVEEARVRDFYEPGGDKIVFWKQL